VHRHAFDLGTGRCLDDAEVGVPVYDVRVVEGMVQVGRRRSVGH
jgi:nitrite reductase (NADH) small subunit